MSRRRRSPTWPALTPAQERGWMRAVYIERFLEDPTTWARLGELRERYLDRLGTGQPAPLVVEATLADCEQLAAAVLRLPDIAADILAWLYWSRDKPANRALAASGSVIAAFSTPSPTGFGGYGPAVTDTRLVIEDTWNPAQEPREAARRRLVQRIEAELDQIETHAEGLGYRILDSRPNGPRDVGWLVERVRDGRTYRAIADRYGAHGEPLGEDAVRHAVQQVAALVGINPES